MDSNKPPNNCTTNISRKLTRQEMTFRGNMRPRPVEMGYDRHMEHLDCIEMLGLAETKRYFAICDAERVIIRRVQQGEHIYGTARWSAIARLAGVTREEVLLVLG